MSEIQYCTTPLHRNQLSPHAPHAQVCASAIRKLLHPQGMHPTQSHTHTNPIFTADRTTQVQPVYLQRDQDTVSRPCGVATFLKLSSTPTNNRVNPSDGHIKAKSCCDRLLAQNKTLSPTLKQPVFLLCFLAFTSAYVGRHHEKQSR